MEYESEIDDAKTEILQNRKEPQPASLLPRGC